MFAYSYPHKICDPVHHFIRFGDIEKKLIDSPFFQRLRYIKQMGVAYLVYPGAIHTRFEHSLGVMELVSRIYDTITNKPGANSPNIPSSKEELIYWRQIVRLAALCHDLGHLPFSHTAERELLPLKHESKTAEMILSPQLRAIWKLIDNDGRDPTLDICKLAVDPHYHNLEMSEWEKMLAKLTTEDNFGADRIDYLIRDAAFTGVELGHFDFHQLIDSIRIVPDFRDKNVLTIGVSESGVQSVESLWMARYLMYSRVFHHKKGRIFSQHMSRFMTRHFEKHGFPATLEGYVHLNDATILVAMQQKAIEGDYDARALLYEVPSYKIVPFNRKELPIKELQEVFKEGIFIDDLEPEIKERLFPVIKYDGSVVAATEASPFLRDIPIGGHTLSLYARPDLVPEVSEWLHSHALV